MSSVMQGMPLSSHWSATGTVVSGVFPATTRWTRSLRMSSAVTSAARLGLDWESLYTISRL